MTQSELTTWACTPKVFLGEPKNTEKLTRQGMASTAFPYTHPPTRASDVLFSLTLWMIHTHDILRRRPAFVLQACGYDAPITHLDTKIRNMLATYVHTIKELDERGSITNRTNGTISGRRTVRRDHQ
jgi:hypothetical protein